MDYQRISSTNGFNWNCGMREHQCERLISNSLDTPEKLIRYFKWLWAPYPKGGLLGAAFMVSDNDNSYPTHESLTKIGVFHNLGRNTNSGSLIYCWIISRNSIKAYEEANRKKTSKKVVGKKGQVKKLSTTNKK